MKNPSSKNAKYSGFSANIHELVQNEAMPRIQKEAYTYHNGLGVWFSLV
jgi:hypothetical protein